MDPQLVWNSIQRISHPLTDLGVVRRGGPGPRPSHSSTGDREQTGPLNTDRNPATQGYAFFSAQERSSAVNKMLTGYYGHAKTTKPFSTKFGGKVAHGPRKFCGNPDHVTLGVG